MARRKPTKATMSKAAARATKEALFVEAYITNGNNGAQAYRAAGFKASNMNVAAVEASKLLRKPNVASALERRTAEALAKSKLTSDETLQSLARTLRFDPRKLYREDGSLKAVHELDADTADALAGVEVVEMAGGMQLKLPAVGKDGKPDPKAEPVVQHVPMFTKKVKWLDKNTAREQAMKHFGHFEVDNSQKATKVVAIGQLTVQPEALNFEKVRQRALKAA